MQSGIWTGRSIIRCIDIVTLLAPRFRIAPRSPRSHLLPGIIFGCTSITITWVPVIHSVPAYFRLSWAHTVAVICNVCRMVQSR
ncbi:hypothetical protein BD410DRAFT_549400 [Rickenella mellea]|uniref:Uncharacterized protein n=1 Tax=Rickenella mellea TaxID=50990 RepID=A0A4Y7PPX0_9AGAM|nr:hypothetical protein BD410DRAFT_549400 [Rickenella mellea]